MVCVYCNDDPEVKVNCYCRDVSGEIEHLMRMCRANNDLARNEMAFRKELQSENTGLKDRLEAMSGELNDVRSQLTTCKFNEAKLKLELRGLASEAWQMAACIAPYDLALSRRKQELLRRCEKWVDL